MVVAGVEWAGARAEVGSEEDAGEAGGAVGGERGARAGQPPEQVQLEINF